MENQEENFDSTNEEQENLDSENEEQVEETEEESNGDSEDESTEDKPEYTEREKQLYAQLQKAKGLKLVNGKWVKPEAETKQKPKKEETVDEVTLTRLEVRGIMDKEDQDYVLRYAKAEGKTAIEVLEDDIVQDRLKANKRKRESDNATPRSNNRANNAQNEVDMWVRKYKKNGELPDNNPALTSKILDALKNGA